MLVLLVLWAMGMALEGIETVGVVSLQPIEIEMLRAASRPTAAAFEAAIPPDAPPLGWHLLRSWGVQGRGDGALRVPALLFGLAALLPMCGLIALGLPSGERRAVVPAMAFGALLLLSLPAHRAASHLLTPHTAAGFFTLSAAVMAFLWVGSGQWGWSAGLAAACALAEMSVYGTMPALAGVLGGAAALAWVRAVPSDRRRRLMGLLPAVTLIVLLALWAWRRAGVPAMSLWLPAPSDTDVSLNRAGPLTSLFCDSGSLILMMTGLAGLFVCARGLFWFFFLLAIPGLSALAAGAIWGARLSGLDVIYPAILPAVALQAIGLARLFCFGGCGVSAPAAPPKRHWIGSKTVAKILIVAIALIMIPSRRVANGRLAGSFPDYRSAVRRLAFAPENSLALVDDSVTKSSYQFYRDERYPGAPDARVFDPLSAFQAHFMLSMDKAYLVWVHAPERSLSTEFRQAHAAARQRPDGGLPSLEMLGFYRVQPEIGPLPEDRRIPLAGPGDSGPFYLVKGWFKPEVWGGAIVRWSALESRVAVRIAPSQAARIGRFRLKGFAWAARKDEPRTFALTLNDRPLGTRTMPARGLHSVEWPVKVEEGINLFVLTTPDDVPRAPDDPRPLSIAVYEIALLSDEQPPAP
ncbi:MAG: hypothetical protein Kow0059_08310 [Candidatus Sumerlaeia bacterium]